MGDGNGPPQAVSPAMKSRGQELQGQAFLASGTGQPGPALAAQCPEGKGGYGQAAGLGHGHSISRMRSSPSSVMSLVTWTLRTVPSTGEVTTVSIFMALSTHRGWPLVTLAPAATLMSITFPTASQLYVYCQYQETPARITLLSKPGPLPTMPLCSTRLERDYLFLLFFLCIAI